MAAIAILPLCGELVSAEVNVVDSLEWMAADAPAIVRGRATHARDVKTGGRYTYRDVTVRVERVYKGKVSGRTLRVRLRVRGARVVGKDWPAARRSYLLFLRPAVRRGKPVGGLWELREPRQSAIDLGKIEKVYAADMTLVRRRVRLLKIVRKWAAWSKPRPFVGASSLRKPQTGYIRLKVRPDTEVYRQLAPLGGAWLCVPATERYRSHAMALTRSKNYWDRARAADMLRNYPGDRTVQRLVELLKDPGQKRWIGPDGELVRIEYPVRRAAWGALVALGRTGEKLQEPVFEESAVRPVSGGDYRRTATGPSGRQAEARK